MKTYKERLTAGLLALGWREVNTASGKYTAFTDGKAGTPILYVGNAGALRVGSCASQSHSIGDPVRQTAFYQKVLAAAPQEQKVVAPTLRSLSAEFGNPSTEASV